MRWLDVMTTLAVAGPFGSPPEWLVQVAWTLLTLCVIGAVLMMVSIVLLLWKARELVKNALEPDLPKLEQRVAELRRRHPQMSDERLRSKIANQQAWRAGVVGFVTGLGGLPTLPFTMPIDLALTVKFQSNLVHMLRLQHPTRLGLEAIPKTSLWLITTGGQELAGASSKLLRELIVQFLSKTFFKIVPLIGGIVGFATNYLSTRALGRLTWQWLNRQAADGQPDSLPEDIAPKVIPPEGRAAGNSAELQL